MNLNKLNSIKTKVLALLGLALLGLIITGWFTLRQAAQLQEEMLFASIEEMACANAEVLERKLQIEMHSLLLTSKSPLLQEEDIYVALTYLHNLQAEKTRQGSAIISLGLVDLEGYLQEAADHDHVTLQRDADFFKAILGGAPLFFSSPDFSEAYPDLIRVVIALPVLKDGQLYRVLHARLELNQFAPLMEELKFGEKGRAFVVDEHGIIVAHPDPDLLLVDWTSPSELIPAEVAAYGRQAVEKVSG